MAIDPDTLLSQAMSHALAYRRALAEDQRPPSADYHAMLERFTEAMPEQGTDAGEVIEALATQALPGLMPMAGPRFFGWVIGASHPAGVAADWLVSAWGQNAGYHSPTPAAAAIEAVAERWLLELLDLPRGQLRRLFTGATVANAVCLAAARTGVLLEAGWDPDADGLFGAPPVQVLIGDDAHSSVFSSLQLIGFGHRAGDDGGHRRPGPHAAAGAGARAGRQAGPENRHRAGGADQHRRVRSVHRDRRARPRPPAPGCMWTARSGCGRAPCRRCAT